MKLAYYFTPSENYYITYEVYLKNLAYQQSKTTAIFEMVMTECEILETITNTLRTEKKSVEFIYPVSEKTPNVIVQRMKKEKDCLMRLINVSNPSQVQIIGIDQIRYDGNPILVRGFHEEENYDVKMTGDIIQEIPISNSQYRFDSTIIDATFDSPEWPTGFLSEDAVYDTTKKFWLLKYGTYNFSRAIRKDKAWTMSFQIAPILMSNDPGAWIFRIISNQIGIFDVYRDRIEFLSNREDAGMVSNSFAAPMIMTDLYFSGLTAKSKFELSYLNQILSVKYNDHGFSYPFIFDETDPAIEHLRFYAADTVPKMYLDNLKIVYHV